MSRNASIAERLQNGETVEWRPHGSSMTPYIESGQLVTMEPCTIEDVVQGDIVFSKVNGSFYLHFVRKKGEDGRVLIGNAHNHDNGWTRKVYGKVTKVSK